MLSMSGYPFYGQGGFGGYPPSDFYNNTAPMNGTPAELLALFGVHQPNRVAEPLLLEKLQDETQKAGQLIGWPTSSSKKPKIEITGPCVVCESEKAGYHFGVHACAACSAFFRRTISENRKYICRKTGSEHLNCPIDKRHRCYCRACRLQKCLAKGMDPNAVQPHRDSIGSKPKCLNSSTASPSLENPESQSHVDTSQPLFINTKSPFLSTSTFNLPSETLIIPKPESPEDDHFTQESHLRSFDTQSMSSDSSSIYSGYEPGRNLIEITVDAYRKLVERRRLFYCSSSVRDILAGTLPIARPAKFLDRVRRHHTRIEVVLFVEFLNSIHPFSKFSVDDKVILMKHLSVSWSILDKYYCTMKGGGLETNRIIHADGTYTDLEDPAAIEFDANDVAGEKLDKETLNKLFITPLQDALREISGPMLHFQMTDVEFCALTAILLFDPTARGLSEQTQPIVKEARDRVYQDWFAFYSARNVCDASERIGNTMLLLPAVQTTVEKTAENMRLIRVFELFDYDPIVDDLLQ